MSSEKTLGQKWLDNIDKAKKYRDRSPHTRSWDRLAKYYTHEHVDSTMLGDEAAVLPNFNLIYMFGRSLMPSIIYQSPQVINSARRPEFVPWASMMDSLDNWLIEEMELDEVFRLAVLYGYLFNIGPVMTCWDFQGRVKPADDRPYSEFMKDLLGFAKVTGVTNRARRFNFPWLDIVDPKKILFAPNTRNMRTCPWFVKSACYSTSALAKYLGQKVEPTHVPKEHKHEKEDSDGDMVSEDQTFVHEIHDARDGTWMMVDADGRVLMKSQEDPLQVDGLPLEAIVFNQAPFSIWGTPDPIYIEGQQQDGDDCRLMGWKQRKVSLLKGLVDESLIDKGELEKFYSEDALPFIRVKASGTTPISQAVSLVQPHIQQEFYAHQEKDLEDAQRILGFGPNQMGTYASGRRTRYEAQIVEDRNQARSSERRELVATAIANTMRRINLLVMKNWKRPIVQRVLGYDLSQYWVEIVPGEFESEGLRDEIRTAVDVASMTPVSNERTKQEMVEVLGVLAKVQGVNVLPIVRQLLTKFPWLNAQEVMPQANPGQPIPQGQFVEQQNRMLNEPGRMAEAQKGALEVLPALLQARGRSA